MFPDVDTKSGFLDSYTRLYACDAGIKRWKRKKITCMYVVAAKLFLFRHIASLFCPHEYGQWAFPDTRFLPLNSRNIPAVIALDVYADSGIAICTAIQSHNSGVHCPDKSSERGMAMAAIHVYRSRLYKRWIPY